MEKERRVTAPEGCEIAKVEIVDGVAVVTFKPQERKLPKSWEEFCKMSRSTNVGESFIMTDSSIRTPGFTFNRSVTEDKNLLPDRATAEAVLALCQLVQLRNCYNGEWVPNWNDEEQEKYVITFVCCDEITITDSYNDAYSFIYFNNEKLAKEFLRNFRDLIEKIKPLYGIMKGIEK